jgi:hypothetical protein
MKYRLYFLTAMSLIVAGALGAVAQTPPQDPLQDQSALQAATPSMMAQAPSAAQSASLAPTDSDVYCAGFYTHRAIDASFAVLGGPDNGLKFEFSAGDNVYMNKGSKFIKAPGGDYLLVRPIKDLSPVEAFPGQLKLVFAMGTLYAEIARIRIQVVHADSSVAEILRTCEPALAGDIAIPMTERPTPPYRQSKITDRYTPTTGKATGTIAAVKGFQEAAGGNSIVYVNLGKKQGMQPGSYLRIFRTYLSASQFMYREGARNFLTEIGGVSIGRKLTPDEINTVPRVVVGEVMVLSAEDETATGIVTYSWQDIYPGDDVELE